MLRIACFVLALASGVSVLAGTVSAAAHPRRQALQISPNGVCGPANFNYTCLGSNFGNCCSSNGFCGATDAYCTVGCKAQYGVCRDYLPVPPPGTGSGPPTGPSPDGSCAGPKRYTCLGSSFGSCCNSDGRCGFSDDFCTSKCLGNFGICRDYLPSPPDGPGTRISLDGTCGGANGLSCFGSPVGPCCSKEGFCGSGPDFCSAQWCNPTFGACEDTPGTTTRVSAPTPVPGSGGKFTSPNGRCGLGTNYTCIGYQQGNCCSKSMGTCGFSDAYCGVDCDRSFGVCNTPPPGVTSSPAPTRTPVPGQGGKFSSPDGTCGGANGYTCIQSPFGDCCGRDGRCGRSDASCGTGCNRDFGACSGPPPWLTTTSSTTRVPVPPTGTPVPGSGGKYSSPDGTCGASVGWTCLSSQFGNCCGRDGRCGIDEAHCGTGCDISYGACRAPPPGATPSPAPISVSRNGQCGAAVGMTCTGSMFGPCCGPAGRCGYSCYKALGCQASYGTCI